ncbi:hypothetical protein [Streptomyces sp. Ag109_O5-1]|uniref:hypothetical protein n=1 Tax=Streptomyces sp. Ag109_O5-1 TaxID=1938851 RepID=UPI000F4E8110|nr:hypothetical protein [Streptomyces sp. Ag109_O5-1]
MHHTSIHEIMVFEADHLDRLARTGWSFTGTWRATAVTSPLEGAGYRDLLIPCMDRGLDQIVRMRAALLAGYRRTC